MTIRIAARSKGRVERVVLPELPASKTHAQRARCLAEFLPLEVRYDAPPASRDLRALDAALMRIREATGGAAGAVDGGWSGEPVRIAENGTATRILSVLIPMLGRELLLDVGPRLRERPLDAALAFLARAGATASIGWPRRLDGRSARWADELVVDAHTTTQVASGALLGAAIRVATGAAPQGHTVRAVAPAAGAYFEVTVAVLAAFGFDVDCWPEGDDLLACVRGWDKPAEPFAIPVVPDPSSYAFVRAFCAAHDLPAPGLDVTGDPHPDWLVVDDIARLQDAPAGEDLVFWEIGRRPDSFPCLVALAALRTGRTSFLDVPALRHKESDRIHAMAEVLRSLDVACEELPDGLTVEGPMRAPRGRRRVPVPDDHRIVMSAAILGTTLPEGVELDHEAAPAKSWPGFFDWLGTVADVTR